MIPANFPQANTVFGPPSDLDPSQCQSIPAFLGTIGAGNLDGAKTVIVAWKPLPEELAQLNAGGLVYLGCIGGLPPHYLCTKFPGTVKGPAIWNILDKQAQPGVAWVRCVAHIRNNKTGEVRKYETDELLVDGAVHPDTHVWEEGNYSCDCNREIFFGRANGVDVGVEVDYNVKSCTSGLYSVNLENPVNGEVYYREFQ